MKPKTMMLMVVAIGCGLVASYMTSRLLAERQQPPPQTVTKPVLVATKKVPMHTPIKEPEKFFVVKELPEEAVPKKALTSFDDIKGKRLSKSINEEAFVYVEDLLDPEKDGLSVRLAAGQRAVAIKVDAQSLVGGFVYPGARVDVICTVRRGDQDSESKILLQDMQVLAVDTKHRKDAESETIIGQTVTLAAKPEEATQLALASAIGELRLMMRAVGDDVKIRHRPTRVTELGKQRFDGPDGSSDASADLKDPPLPTELPPVPEKVETPVVEAAPKPPEEPVKEHTLTIVSGEFTTRHKFVWDKQENSWKASVAKTPAGDEAQPRRDVPPPPPVVAPPRQPADRPIPSHERKLPVTGGPGANKAPGTPSPEE
jgi:pilus assembly protein CpaB